MATALSIAYDVLLTAGVLLLGIGFFWKDVRAHLVRAAGWSVFGVFWFLHVADYADQEDALNALGAAVALPVFLFVAFHERLSYRWREEYEPLRFACGAAFFASAVYFAFARIPELAARLVQVVADETATLLTWMGYPFAAGPPTCGGVPGTGVAGCENGEAVMVGLFPATKPTEPLVNIVLACTALQAYAVAASLMLSTRDPWRRKALALGIVLPVTWVMNLVRNVVVIYFFGIRGDAFELVHNWYGKTLSLAVLLVLIFVAFKLLPELYLNINGLFELPWRKRPNHDYRKFVGRLSSKKKAPTTPAPGTATTRRSDGTGGDGRTPPSSP
ncbi:MAG: archaeosortase A [Methanobacteriota archaeon]|nr:MAG: archaeosortase A [Euryarchaeota archaeon]